MSYLWSKFSVTTAWPDTLVIPPTFRCSEILFYTLLYSLLRHLVIFISSISGTAEEEKRRGRSHSGPKRVPEQVLAWFAEAPGVGEQTPRCRKWRIRRRRCPRTRVQVLNAGDKRKGDRTYSLWWAHFIIYIVYKLSRTVKYICSVQKTKLLKLRNNPIVFRIFGKKQYITTFFELD